MAVSKHQALLAGFSGSDLTQNESVSCVYLLRLFLAELVICVLGTVQTVSPFQMYQALLLLLHEQMKRSQQVLACNQLLQN